MPTANRRPTAASLAPRAKLAFLLVLTLLTALAAMAAPPLAQDPGYHRFADTRSFAGIAHFADVASNLPFLLAGLAGLIATARAAGAPDSGPRPAYLAYGCFFLGLTLTSAGSAHYHLAPSNQTLLWDRLPMTVAFMAVVALVIQERIGVRAGLAALGPLVLFGTASVAYWHLTEAGGRGDLRPYAVVQFYPLILAPLILVLYRGPYLRASDLAAMLALYGAAKGLELADQPIYALTGVVSGHTLKHLAAAGAGLRVLAILRRRVTGERARTRAERCGETAATAGPARRLERSSRHIT